MDHLLTSDSLISLLSLTLLEIVLGVDNIIFISIIAAKLPASQQSKARQFGLLLAMGVRVVLLYAISWIISLKENLFFVFEHGISGRDLILLGGGLFLMAKTVTEIHAKLEGEAEPEEASRPVTSFTSTLIQIVLIDIVFSFDSILTAVGLAKHIEIMVAAVIVSISVMMIYARRISIFIHKRPTFKMLALCFLIMIGALLVAEAFEVHVPKTTLYFAMAFALVVEILNQKVRKKTRPVQLRGVPLEKDHHNS